MMQQDNTSYKRIFESIWKIEKAVLETVDFSQATEKVVNIILTELGLINSGYQAIVLTLLDSEKKVLRRIAISHTETAGEFLRATPIPFNDIVIPLWAEQNLSVRAIKEHKMFVSENVSEIFVPAMDREWVDDMQKTLGTKTAIVYPIIAKEKVLGALIFTLTKREAEIKEEEWSILESFVGAVGIALDNALLFKSLNETSYRLEQMDKLKDEFVSTASHELKTPMTVIQGYVLKILNEEKELSDVAKERLNKVYTETQRLINLVDGMLNISRIESGAMQFNFADFDMAKLANEVREELSDTYTKKGLTFEVGEGIYNIHCDRDKIYQVLLNLIENAIMFTPDKGKVEISFKVSGNNLETSVTDSGIGIKPEDLGKLFVKFERLDNAASPIFHASGAGLGLYLTKKIIEMLGGKIEVQSEFGKGSKFTFSIPVA